MPFNIKKRGSYFISSDSSITINRHNTTNPRVCTNNTFPNPCKLASEKNAHLPRGNTKVLVVDSSGEKYTKLVDTSVANLDYLKAINVEEGILMSQQKKKMLSSSKSDKIGKERLDIKGMKNRCNVRRAWAVNKISRKHCSVYPIHYKCCQTQSTSTQTEELKYPILKENRNSVALRRSSSRIFYQDITDNKSQDQKTQPLLLTNSGNLAAGDGVKKNCDVEKLFCTVQKGAGREQQSPMEPVRQHLNHYDASTIHPQLKNAQSLAKYRTAQRFSTMEPNLPKEVGCSRSIIKEFSNINRNGKLRRGLSIIFFLIILTWFLQAVFRISFPTDIFRVVTNYLYNLPIFVKRPRRELTKVEIAAKYISNMFQFFEKIFRS